MSQIKCCNLAYNAVSAFIISLFKSLLKCPDRPMPAMQAKYDGPK